MVFKEIIILAISGDPKYFEIVFEIQNSFEIIKYFKYKIQIRSFFKMYFKYKILEAKKYFKYKYSNTFQIPYDHLKF